MHTQDPLGYMTAVDSQQLQQQQQQSLSSSPFGFADLGFTDDVLMSDQFMAIMRQTGIFDVPATFQPASVGDAPQIQPAAVASGVRDNFQNIAF